MSKKMPISLAIAIVFIAMTVTFSLTMIYSQRLFDKNVTSVQEKYAAFDKLSKIDITVRNNFNGTINDDTLMDTLAAGYVAGLGDKYSKYYTSAQYSEMVRRSEGKSISIGVDLAADSSSGYAKITTVYANSPAAEAGMAVGDYITYVGETSTRGLTVERVKNLLYGNEGEGVMVTYVAFANGEEKTADIVRHAYSVPTVTTELVGENGYVKISDITENTPVEFDSKVNSLKSNGAKTLVFDVRNINSNDYNSVHRILDILLPSGTLIYGTYNDGTTKVLYTSDPREINMPMVVIVNENTAGAGEMFAALLRESGKAKIVGVETAGRGTLQQTFVQADGSAIEITVAKLTTAGGLDYNGTGITPDYESTLSGDQAQNSYLLTTADDPQILRAFEVADGMTASDRSQTENNAVSSSSQETENTEAAA